MSSRGFLLLLASVSMIWTAGCGGGGGSSQPIAPSPLVVATPALPNSVQGQPYSQALQASGGTPPYLWSGVAGGIPGGLSVDPAGVLAGSPLSAGNVSCTVQVSDSSSPRLTVQKIFSLSV